MHIYIYCIWDLVCFISIKTAAFRHNLPHADALISPLYSTWADKVGGGET